jgi:hypothetical protein
MNPSPPQLLRFHSPTPTHQSKRHEQTTRDNNKHVHIHRNRVLRKKAYKPLCSTVPDHAIGNAFLPAVPPATRPFASPTRERFGSPPRSAMAYGGSYGGGCNTLRIQL